MVVLNRIFAGVLTVSVVSLPASVGAQVSGEQAFATCRTCHSIAKGAPNKLGPNLYGVVGRPAASLPGYTYSPALKASKLVWNEATLDEYLAAPMKKVPGTKMPIATPDPARRALLIAYLKAEGSK